LPLRITNRQQGQIYHGEPTRIEWTADKIVLPNISGNEKRDAIIDDAIAEGDRLAGSGGWWPASTSPVWVAATPLDFFRIWEKKRDAPAR
jgi:hypothetical protein